MVNISHHLLYPLQFSIFAYEIRERFKILNQKLETDFFFFSENIKIIHDKRFPLRLKRFSLLYHDLCNGIELINSHFTFQLVFILSSCLVSCRNLKISRNKLNVFQFEGVLAAYAIVEILMGIQNSTLSDLLPNIFALLICYFSMIILAYSGSSVKNTAEETFVIISKFMSQTDDMKTKFHFLIFLHQLKQEIYS
jgi:hypothetical protein